jgi:hypothetical protein
VGPLQIPHLAARSRRLRRFPPALACFVSAQSSTANLNPQSSIMESCRLSRSNLVFYPERRRSSKNA